MRKLNKKAKMQGTGKLRSYRGDHPSVFVTILLTTDTGNVTAILQLLLLKPSKAFKPLMHLDFLGTVAQVSQLVWESDTWVFFSLLHNLDCRSAVESGANRKHHCCLLRSVTRDSLRALGKPV